MKTDKDFQLQGRALLTSHQKLCPWTPTPVIGSIAPHSPWSKSAPPLANPGSTPDRLILHEA